MTQIDFKNVQRTEKWKAIIDTFLQQKTNKKEFNSNPVEHIQAHVALSQEWKDMRHFFVERLYAAEFHWFFVQGVDALMNGLYVPAVSSMLNGIEASLRVTVDQISNPKHNVAELSPYKVLSNTLIKNAKDLGLPAEFLAFPNETDFDIKLESVKPNKIDVEIVRQRNNICHGNIFEFVNRDLGPENSFFTPVALRKLSFELLDISGNWAEELGKFRKNYNSNR